MGAGLVAASAATGLALIGAPSAMAGAGCANANAGLSSLSKGETRTAFICLFNQSRSAADVFNNRDLQQAAQSHTNTMRAQNCFSHQCSGEPGLKQRVRSTGYFNGGGRVGEIIAYADADPPPPGQPNGEDTPNTVVNRWLNSSIHRSLIRDAGFEDVGVGVNVQGGDALITAVFGKA
jgi:uncharacterized protein YkwD